MFAMFSLLQHKLENVSKLHICFFFSWCYLSAIAFAILYVCACGYYLNEQVQSAVVVLTGKDEIGNLNIIPKAKFILWCFLSLFFLHRRRGKMLSIEYI